MAFRWAKAAQTISPRGPPLEGFLVEEAGFDGPRRQIEI
jgi:hypothetical protein